MLSFPVDANNESGHAGIAPHWYYWDRYAWRDERWPKSANEMGASYLADARIKMIHDPGEDWVPAFSCFGGFAVYRRAAIKECRDTYRGNDEAGRSDCEHVTFSRCIRTHGSSLYMNPSAWLRYDQLAYYP